ncbi:MAG: hypothetical protein ACRC7N_00600 [Clostridium sp.]
MGLFSKKNKDGNRSINVAYVDGLLDYNKGAAVEVSFNDEFLEIKSRVIKSKPVVKLALNQIIAANCITEKDVIEKSKSVTSRAVVGGVLLGPLGAIIGGITGVGNKTKSETKYYMVVNYKSRDEELKVLSFEIVGASLQWSSFIQELRNMIKKEDIIENEIYL